MKRLLANVEVLNFRKYPTDRVIDSNLLVLYQRLKQVEALYVAAGGEPFSVTSGLRSDAQQKELIKAGKSTATKSKHLRGMAADIEDPDAKLKDWLLQNPEVLVDANLWCEHFDHTPNWCHFQIAPPASGRRWFIP